MKEVVVVTDSSCDLPKEILEQYPIKVMTMPVSVKDNPNMDISNLTLKEFYDAMRRGEILPTTSQVVVSAFMQCFEECRNNGQIPIVLGLSSKLTGSFDSALLAKENLQFEEAVIFDTKCASLGLGMVVLKAAKMAKEGKDIQEIAEEAKHYA